MTKTICDSLLKRCRAFFVDNGLAPAVADHILSFQRPTLELKTQAVDPETIPIGHTRIGGSPDLPSGVEWPLHADEPMFFLGQLNLGQLTHPAADEGLLPSAGVLSFFFTSSFDHIQDPGAGRVLYFDDPSQLTHRPQAPERDYGNFQTCRVEPLPRLTFPDWTSPVASLMKLNQDDDTILSNIIYDAEGIAAGTFGGGHRLLGYPHNGQSDATFTAAQTFLEDGEDSSDDAVEVKARDWRLLFQCKEDEAAGMDWVDSGSVCFVMRTEDLKARRFDRVFADLQFD